MHDSLSYGKGPHATLRSDPIRLVDYKGGCKQRAKENDILTLFKEFRHDVLVMVGCFYFFCNVRSGIFQVFCNAANFLN